MSFSSRVKSELFGLFEHQQPAHYILLGTALMTNGRFQPERIIFSTTHGALADLMARCLEEELGVDAGLSAGKGRSVLKIQGRADCGIIARFLREEFGYEPERGIGDLSWIQPVMSDPDEEAQRGAETPPWVQILKAAFLAGGSFSEPTRAYHLEISVRPDVLAGQLRALLGDCGISADVVRRGRYHVIYLKEGEQLGDFLALTGAHEARLVFEEYRMARELRNRVNRVVNCDSANARRIADASARQLRQLERVKACRIWQTLPEDLRMTAELRLEHPDLSLRELGELMEPPLGKSGVNHRLKKLEQLAGDEVLPGVL